MGRRGGDFLDDSASTSSGDAEGMPAKVGLGLCSSVVSLACSAALAVKQRRSYSLALQVHDGTRDQSNEAAYLFIEARC